MSDAPARIVDLVKTFDRNIEAYQSHQYNEAQLRREFIDPVFEELGWDVTNKAGYAPQYRDVIHEDAINVAGATKAPDYCFRIGGIRKFFLEAKRPSVNIKTDSEPAYQLRRYAWSAKLPLSILTNFEVFAVYDCQNRPKHTDGSSTARIMYLTYKEYPHAWNDIAGIFSKNAILQGSFDKFAVSPRAKRGTTTVDTEFLSEIESWRKMLAQIIARGNMSLSQQELNFAVQQTINRILFLRLCEDRGIEPYAQLRALIGGDRVYPRLCEIFEKADQRYNSGLFHFEDEPNRPEPPDKLTLNLIIDDDKLKWILGSLYYPRSPYEFSVLPAEILGNVYEQFLGKVISLTPGHHAKVEEKPEVKKAGGVYYTPAYIVDYIVKNTVGRLVEGKNPKQIERLKILDPACGSGSFLLGAYTYLLNYHLDWYMKNDSQNWLKKKNPPIYQTASLSGHCEDSRRSVNAKPHDEAISNYRLTIAEKKKILLNNIFGVDIDSQAVEVTKLSLLLKVLEGENSQTLDSQYRFFHERALPDLANNIKCGNSLIAPDFYDNLAPDQITDDLRRKINAFDWHSEFPQIFKCGGFDAVIGNPPYRMLQPHNTDEPVLLYLRRNYVAAEFKIEMFHLFLQRGVLLLKDGACLGHIVPTTILNNVYAQALREWLMKRCCIVNISVARDQVFAGADVHTSVVTLRRESAINKRLMHEIFTTSDLSEEFVIKPTAFSRIQQRRFGELPGRVWNILINETNAPLIVRLTGEFPKLKAVATINRGLITGARDKYFSKNQKSKAYVPIIAGGDVHRYFTAPPSEFVLFERPETAGGCWDREVHLARHKIVVRQIGFRPMASILRGPIAVTGNIFTVRGETIEQELYLLGIINSRLTDFFWRTMFADFKRSFPQVTIFSLAQLPIRFTDFSKTADQSRHERLVALVEQMLELHKKLAAAKIPDEKTKIQRQIAATDNQIDQFVYKLYGLTEEEIKIVEESSK